MSFHCKGTCINSPSILAVPHSCGRIPNDPDTGRPPPVGTYGSWRKCRTCAILIHWQGKFCPCCGFFLSKRPRASRYRNSAKNLAMDRKAATVPMATGGE